MKNIKDIAPIIMSTKNLSHQQVADFFDFLVDNGVKANEGPDNDACSLRHDYSTPDFTPGNWRFVGAAKFDGVAFTFFQDDEKDFYDTDSKPVYVTIDNYRELINDLLQQDEMRQEDQQGTETLYKLYKSGYTFYYPSMDHVRMAFSSSGAVFEAMNNAVIVVDPDGKLVKDRYSGELSAEALIDRLYNVI